MRRTQSALESALIELIEQRQEELSQIAVADVAERADVNRSTFYAHYRDVHELAEAACTAMIDDLIETLSVPDPEDHDRNPHPWLQGFFANLAEHASLYGRLLGPGGSARVIDHLVRRTTAFFRRTTCSPGADDSVVGHVAAGFAAGGLIGVATDWLQRGCPETPAELAIVTRPLLSQALRRP